MKIQDWKEKAKEVKVLTTEEAQAWIKKFGFETLPETIGATHYCYENGYMHILSKEPNGFVSYFADGWRI